VIFQSQKGAGKGEAFKEGLIQQSALEVAEIVPIYPPISSLPASALTLPAFTITMQGTTMPPLGDLLVRIL
jgi:hypothetical protein